jgi:protein TonB
MTDAGSQNATSTTHAPARGNPAGLPLLHAYRIRMLTSVAFTLLLLIGVVRLPLLPDPARVGWQAAAARGPDPISLRELQHRWIEADEASGTTESAPHDARPLDAPPDHEPPPTPVEEPALPSPSSLDSRPAVLSFSQQMPSIEGGLSAYYVHITYPQAAVAAGIEGRLVLEFTVEVDGVPTHIDIIKPLHPLCDSAAVRALRKTRFVPGRHEDQVVAVRMRLPVSFQLINTKQPPPRDRKSADSTLTASW